MQESKNTYKPLIKAHQRGLDCEAIVIQDYQKRGFRLRSQRVKTPFAEIDLVFSGPEHEIILVEVKSATHDDFLAYRVSEKQKNRLRRAQQYYLGRFNEVLLELAVVSQDNKVTVIPDIFC